MSHSKITRARQHETVDQISLRVYGTTAMTDAIYEANPDLADLGICLPPGTPVIVPEHTEPEPTPPLSLWD